MTVHVYAGGATVNVTPTSPPADTTPPDTVIVSGPASSTATTATITFTGSDNAPGTLTFEGSLDGAAFAPVSSPVALSGLAVGQHTYAVRAKDAAGNLDGTAAMVTWAVQAASGFPLSADFVRLADDPSGRDIGYGMFKRMADGRGVTFGGDSHNPAGDNSVRVFDPAVNGWTIKIANTVATWASGSNVSGRTFLGNRDNHNPLMQGNLLHIVGGERGVYLIGNLSGTLNLATWQWTILDAAEPFGLPSDWINNASGWIPGLGVGYMLAGDRNGNPNAGLVRINADGTLSHWWNVDNETPFAGAQNLRYVSNSHFVRGNLVYVYGGWHYALAGQSAPAVNGRTLYACDVTVPSLAVVSDNTLPEGQRIEGGELLADYDAARDWLIVTNGKLVNVYAFASNTWANVPVNTAADADRESPSPAGAGRQGFWSPETQQFVMLGGHSKCYGLRLNF